MTGEAIERSGAGDPRPSPLRRLLEALGLGLLGPLALAVQRVLGTGGAGAVEPVLYLAWLALLAPAAGALAGARGLGLFPFGLAVPGLWLAALALAGASAAGGGPPGSPPLPRPFQAALVVTGLFAAGLAFGCRSPRADPALALRVGCARAGLLLLVGALLAGLAGRGGAPGRPLEPGLAALALDLSPVTLALESAGVDWMRDPAVYDPAGTDRFLRHRWRGSLAGPLTLLVGCALALAAELRRRRPAP